MEAVVAHQIWNYIGMLGVDRETARDLYQEAETAIWEAIAHRQTTECHSYQVQTGIGAIRHWLRDRYSLVRIPGYLHDRGEATSHMKTIVPLEDMNETEGESFVDDLLERLEVSQLRQRVLALLPRLTRAEQQVMEALLTGRSIRDIARERKVRVGCVYAQRSKAILKMRRLLAQDEQGTLPAIVDHLEVVKGIVLEIGQRNGQNEEPVPIWNDLLAEIASQLGLKAYTARVRLRKLNQRYPGLVAMKHRRYLPSTYYIRPEAIAESQKKVVPSVAPVQSARTPAPRQTAKPRKRATPQGQPRVWLLEAKTRLSRQRINDYLPKLRERHRELATLLLAGKPQEEIRQAMGYDEKRFPTARYELVRALKNLAAGKEPYGWLKPRTLPLAPSIEQAA